MVALEARVVFHVGAEALWEVRWVLWAERISERKVLSSAYAAVVEVAGDEARVDVVLPLTATDTARRTRTTKGKDRGAWWVMVQKIAKGTCL